jgi:hypothetical protein
MGTDPAVLVLRCRPELASALGSSTAMAGWTVVASEEPRPSQAVLDSPLLDLQAERDSRDAAELAVHANYRIELGPKFPRGERGRRKPAVASADRSQRVHDPFDVGAARAKDRHSGASRVDVPAARGRKVGREDAASLEARSGEDLTAWDGSRPPNERGWRAQMDAFWSSIEPEQRAGS